MAYDLGQASRGASPHGGEDLVRAEARARGEGQTVLDYRAGRQRGRDYS
jgi:hypothetical protein